MIYKDKVLSALFTEHVQILRLNLKPEMFSGVEKVVYSKAMQFFSRYASPISKEVMLEYSKEMLAPVQKEIEEIVNRVIKGELNFSKTDVSFWMEKFVVEYKDEYLKTLLKETSVANYEEGSDKAISKIQKGLSDLTLMTDDGTISGPLHESVIEIKERLERFEKNPNEAYGMLTQFDLIDNNTNGGKYKDFWTIAAYTGQCKTALLCNFAYTTAYILGKNCVIVTKEMGKEEIDSRLVLICACREFGVVIDSRAFDAGELTPDQREVVYDKVIPFLQKCKGHLEVFQVPAGTTIADLHCKLQGLHNVIEGGLDAVFMDGLLLLNPTKKRTDVRTEFDNLVVEARDVALNFADGRGVWWVNTHQINKEGYDHAQKAACYNLTHLSMTREMERSSTFIMWLYATKDDSFRNMIKLGVLKNRKGACFVSPEYVTCFWPCYTLFNREEPATRENKFLYKEQ